MDEEEIVIDQVEKRSMVMKLIIILVITSVVVGIGFFTYRFFNRNFGPVNEAAKQTLAELGDTKN